MRVIFTDQNKQIQCFSLLAGIRRRWSLIPLGNFPLEHPGARPEVMMWLEQVALEQKSGRDVVYGEVNSTVAAFGIVS